MQNHGRRSAPRRYNSAHDIQRTLLCGWAGSRCSPYSTAPLAPLGTNASGGSNATVSRESSGGSAGGGQRRLLAGPLFDSLGSGQTWEEAAAGEGPGLQGGEAGGSALLLLEPYLDPRDGVATGEVRVYAPSICLARGRAVPGD